MHNLKELNNCPYLRLLLPHKTFCIVLRNWKLIFPNNQYRQTYSFFFMKTRPAMTQWHMSAIAEADVEGLVIFYVRERTIVQIINDD